METSDDALPVVVETGEALRPEEILGHLRLLSDGGGRRGEPGSGAGIVQAGVTLARPLVYPMSADEVSAPLRRRAESFGVRYLGMLFVAELDGLPRGRAYAAGSLSVALEADARAVGLQANKDVVELLDGSSAAQTIPAPDGLRQLASTRPGCTSVLGRPISILDQDGVSRALADARSSGLFGPEFAWAFDASGRGRLLDRRFVTHAVVEVPADLETLRGRMSYRVTVQRVIGSLIHLVPAESRISLSFAEPIDGGERYPDPAVRFFVLADVQKYSTRMSAEAARVQARLVEVMERARAATGLTAEDCQTAGDSVLFVFPPGIDEGQFVRRFYPALGSALAEVNLDLLDDSRLRLRVAMDRGHSGRGGAGWVGKAPVRVARLIDSQPARVALNDSTADFVLVVSDSLYQDVLADQVGPPERGTFARAQVDLPAKGFAETAWVHIQ